MTRQLRALHAHLRIARAIGDRAGELILLGRIHRTCAGCDRPLRRSTDDRFALCDPCRDRMLAPRVVMERWARP